MFNSVCNLNEADSEWERGRGEVSEWVNGQTWQREPDNFLLRQNRWHYGIVVDSTIFRKRHTFAHRINIGSSRWRKASHFSESDSTIFSHANLFVINITIAPVFAFVRISSETTSILDKLYWSQIRMLILAWEKNTHTVDSVHPAHFSRANI